MIENCHFKLDAHFGIGSYAYMYITHIEQQMQVNGEKENAWKQNTQASPWRRTLRNGIEVIHTQTHKTIFKFILVQVEYI